MRFDSIPQAASVMETDTEKIVSLVTWTRRVLVEVMTTTMYGQSFLDIEPSFLDSFHGLDLGRWKLTFKIPPLFAKKMFAEKVIQRSLDVYFDQPQEQRSDACWMIKALEAELRAEGYPTRDVSTYLLLLYWVYVIANAFKVRTKVLMDILQNQIECLESYFLDDLSDTVRLRLEGCHRERDSTAFCIRSFVYGYIAQSI
jgi:hypothetical protein